MFEVNLVLKRIWTYASSRRRHQFILLLVLMLVASLAEVITVGSVLPFIGVLTAPEKIYSHELAKYLVAITQAKSPPDLVLPIVFAFATLATIATGVRLLMQWTSIRYAYSFGSDVSRDMLRVVLNQSFSEHLNRNSSEIVSSLIKRTDIVIAVILASLNLFAAIAILIAMIFVLLALHPLLAIAVVGVFSLVYFLIIRFTKRRLAASSRAISTGNTLMIKALQESLGGIRDILIDGVQEVYVGRFTALDLPTRRSQSIIGFISVAPRYLMETIGILAIAVLAYVVSQREGGLMEALPWLGLLILGSQRMLPLVQQIYHSWATIMGGLVSLDIVLGIVEKKMAPLPIHQPVYGLMFQHQISFNKVFFQYEKSTGWVFKQLDLVIAKGTRVGIVGVTGSGKTTLTDLLMGLLDVNEGQLCIDNTQLTAANRRSWQNRIAHVPQNIYISDASIEENIGFGVPVELLDHVRVRQSAERAQLSTFIEGLPLAYKTLVGERGARLSGGQRQRIGLARALYKNVDVIILDEATSALDVNTEDAVMQTINHLSRDLTIIMIAHRISTLRICDEIVEIGDSGVKKIWSYAELAKKHSLT